MNDQVRQALRGLLRSEGPRLADDAPRCRERLTAVCPGHPREVDILCRAAEARVAARLDLTADGAAWPAVADGLARRLTEQAGLAPDEAAWAVEVWADALGRGQTAGDPSNDAAYAAFLRPAARSARGRIVAVLALLLLGVVALFAWWHFQRPELRRFEGHSAAVLAVDFSPDSTLVLSSSSDKTVRLWERETGREVRRLGGHLGVPLRAAFALGGKAVVTASNETEFRGGERTFLDLNVRLWDVETGAEIRRVEGLMTPVLDMAVSADGARAVTGHGIPDYKDGQWVLKDGKTVWTDCVARLWDLNTGRELRRFEGHATMLMAVALAPDGRRLLTGSSDGTMILWDVETGKPERRFSEDKEAAARLAFFPDGRRALVTRYPALPLPVRGPVIQVYDLETGAELEPFVGQSGRAFALAFGPTGRRFLSGGQDFIVRLWDANEGQLVRGFRGHTREVNAVAVAPDGRVGLSAGEDFTIRLWRLPE